MNDVTIARDIAMARHPDQSVIAVGAGNVQGTFYLVTLSGGQDIVTIESIRAARTEG
jgi:hypothetical protein